MLVRRLIARAKRRGFPITDEVWSDAQWGLIQAAIRFDPDHGSTWKSAAFPWVQGAIGRSLRRAARHQSNESDPPARPDFEPSEERAAQIRLLRLAVERIDSPLREVAALRLDGLGIRRIAKALGRSFHQVKIQYAETTDIIARAVGFRWDEGLQRHVTVPRLMFEEL